MTTATFENLRLSSKYMGRNASLWDSTNAERQFLVDVVNLNDGSSISYEFYVSVNRFEKKGVEELTESELLDSFDCFLTDMELGDYDIDDFYENLYRGSDIKISQLIKIWKLCKDCRYYFSMMTAYDSQELEEFIYRFRHMLENK